MNKIQTDEGWWIIEQDSHIGAWVRQEKRLDHDSHLPPLACLNMPEGGVVIDCGALYGDHTIAYCRKVGSQGTVLAIEASKMAYDCLCENAKQFESPVICIHAVLCESHGGHALHCVEEGNLGCSHITEDDKKGVEVRTISIDGLTKDAGLSRLDFLKIDCEGYEYQILKGARGSIKQFKPKMMIEINHGALAAQGDHDRKIYDLLLDLGYCWQLIQPQCKPTDPQFDILCWPNPIKVEEKNLIV